MFTSDMIAPCGLDCSLCQLAHDKNYPCAGCITERRTALLLALQMAGYPRLKQLMDNNNAADKAIKNIKTVAEDPVVTMDNLYEAYEEMCFRDPTVLDKDDIYPHSKQWRTTDRYNLAKLAVLTEAVKTGKRIAETEAYKKFVGAKARRAMAQMKWD